MKALKHLLLLLCLLFPLNSLAQTAVEQRCTHHHYKHKNDIREYYLYTPNGLEKGAPFIICLHGYTGSAIRGKAGLMDAAEKYGFAVCFPQGLRDPKGKSGWNVGYPPQEGMKTDDIDFVVKLTQALRRQNSFGDAFLTGMSNGGEMCYLMAQKKPEVFKAIASIAGLTLCNMFPLRYRKPVPFMEVHGTKDRTSAWEGDPENKGGWGAYMAVPAAISHLVVANGCISMTTTELDQKEGGNKVLLHHFSDGKPAFKGGPSADVLLYEVIGGNHNWADKDMDTYEHILKFFKRYL